MKARDGNGWDAETYDNVSTIQEEFALKLIQLRNWTGKDVVQEELQKFWQKKFQMERYMLLILMLI